LLFSFQGWHAKLESGCPLDELYEDDDEEGWEEGEDGGEDVF